MIEEQDLGNSIEIIMHPEKYGYVECKSCEGFGGDNRRADGVPHELCEDCGGDGVIKETKGITLKAKNSDGETVAIFDESGFSSGAGVK